jgi:hypothetical protein
MARVLVGGALCGALAVLLFHQSTTFLLYHQFPTLQALFGLPVWMRPPSPGFVTHIVPPLWVPQIIYFCMWGGIWGAGLGVMISHGRAPQLLTGFLLGALGCTSVGFANEPGAFVALNWTGHQVETWMRPGLINGAWGWGAAGLMRSFGFLEVRR